MDVQKADYVSASELADYIYCECCWADKIDGTAETTPEMLAGTAAHERLHIQIKVLEFLKQVAIIVIAGSAVLLVVSLIIIFLMNR